MEGIGTWGDTHMAGLRNVQTVGSNRAHRNVIFWKTIFPVLADIFLYQCPSLHLWKIKEVRAKATVPHLHRTDPPDLYIRGSVKTNEKWSHTVSTRILSWRDRGPCCKSTVFVDVDASVAAAAGQQHYHDDWRVLLTRLSTTDTSCQCHPSVVPINLPHPVSDHYHSAARCLWWCAVYRVDLKYRGVQDETTSHRGHVPRCGFSRYHRCTALRAPPADWKHSSGRIQPEEFLIGKVASTLYFRNRYNSYWGSCDSVS